MIDLNKLLIAGRLTRDPDCRSTQTGRSVANFGMAVNRRFKDASGQLQDAAVFFDCQAWEQRADFARNYLHKGSAVLIEGRLHQETWVDQQTQQNRHKVVIVADRLQFAESKTEAEARQQGESPAQARPATAPTAPARDDDSARPASTDDDLPF